MRRKLEDRADAVRGAVRRSIRQESEGERAEQLEAALERLLEEYQLNPRFAVQPVDDMVGFFRRSLGLPRDIDLGVPKPPPH